MDSSEKKQESQLPSLLARISLILIIMRWKKKKHCTTKSEQQFSWKYIVSRKKTAIYAPTDNKTKKQYDYHAEKEIKNEKIKSQYQIKSSFFVKP